MRHSGISMLTATIVAVVAYLIGFTHSWTAQALSDWKSRKIQMRAQRSLFFSGFWKMMQYCTIGVLIAAVLIVWVVRDEADGDRDTPMLPPQLNPAASCSPGPPAARALKVTPSPSCRVTSKRAAR